MHVISERNTVNYKWGDGCDGWHFLKTDGLAVIKERMPPNTSEKLHYHEEARQFFFILSGEAVFEIDGKNLSVSEHEGIFIEPLSKHKIMNNYDLDLEFLVISQPESHGDRINLE